MGLAVPVTVLIAAVPEELGSSVTKERGCSEVAARRGVSLVRGVGEGG